MTKMKRLAAAALALVTLSTTGVSTLAAEEIYIEDEITAESTETYYYGDIYSLQVSEFDQSSVTLSWQYYGNDTPDCFEIAQLDTATNTCNVIATADADATEYKITGLTGCTEYTFAVRAVITTNGERQETRYKAVVIKTSPAPTTLRSAAYKGRGKISVKWNAVSGADGYVVQYSTSKTFPSNGRTVSKDITSSGKTSCTISGLAATKYYVRVLPYTVFTYGSSTQYLYSANGIKKKSVYVRSGLSLKELINRVDSKSNSGKDKIKELTNNGVNISKYSTTYDKFMAIYKWHTQNAKKFSTCLTCNSNFNDCIYYLFGQPNDPNIWIAAGNYINNSGSRVMHKWSAVYLAGVPYLFDPRMQKYVNPSGTNYFGFGMKSSLAKAHYDFQGWFYCTNQYARYYQ